MSDNESCSSSEYERWLTEQLKQCTDINHKQAHCNVCNRTMNKGDKVSHVEGNSHERETEKLLNKHKIERIDTDEFIYRCKLCDSYTDNFMTHIKSNYDHENWTWINGGVNKGTLKYHVYDAALQTAEAKNYRAIYNNMLIYNYVRKLNDTHFFCDTCHLNLNFTTEISHMFDQAHIAALKANQRKRKL